MKKIRIIVILIMIFTLGSIFAACSKSAKYDIKGPVQGSGSYEYDKDDAPMENNYGRDQSTEESGLTSISPITSGSTDNTSMDKIITRVSLEVETQEFDTLVSIIKDEIVRLGGYDERTEISGKSYYSSRNLRHAYIVARIPKDRLNEFVTVVKDNGNVINENSSSDNVTLQYVDTMSRKKSLEIEQERLWSLLEKTDNLEDIIALESRLSSIRYELQMYETELRTIDNKVEYSTVTISINEVERMTPTSEEKETVFTRIKNGFSETVYNITEGLKDFFVWFVVNLPYLIIWAVIITAAVFIIKRIYKKKRNRRDYAPKIDIRIKDENIDKQK
ncbi:MAG TPA: DUF4349 domain-containing protein [Clostridiales bacterium]|nr:DUF4349 domain-containing protein [Clostridiales bacterium]